MINTQKNYTATEILNTLTLQEKITFFENTLMSTNRSGISEVINFIKQTDFYTAPSSASYHSNYKGGLLDHSLLVYENALHLRDHFIEMNSELLTKFPVESIAIVALLHDICKTGFYMEKTKWKKDANEQWVSYPGYEIKDTFPIGHGEKSVIMLLNIGLQLTVDEMLAIRWHMGAWDGALLTNDAKFSYQTAMGNCPLMTLIQTADNTSSLLFEKQNIY